MSHTREDKLQALGRIIDTLDILRVQCPWDRKQTNESLRANTIEETYELSQALLEGSADEIRKELGDVLLHILFYAKIADEKGQFDIADVADALNAKLIFRHPHVFGSTEVTDAKDVVENWAHCDVFCSSLKKRLKGHEADFFGYIQKYLASESSWAVRVGLVVMLEYYLTADDLRESLRRTGEVRSDFYYVRMAQAWLLATAWAKDPQTTREMLENLPLEEWIYRKFVQKACESYRVTSEDKAWLRESVGKRNFSQI